MDEIRIRELKIYAYHGVFESEAQQGQNFYINATLFLDTEEAGVSDDLSKSVHYGEVSLFFEQEMKAKRFQLIEAAAQNLAERTLLKFPLIRELELEIRKPEAPIPMTFSSVSVNIRRGWHRVYVALGSNMGESRLIIENAVERLRNHELIRNVRCSRLIVTKPYGGVQQEDFLNGALELETIMSPRRLLDFLHELEQEAGRERKIHWGPRTLDLDILLYDDLILESRDLTIPHTDMKNRDFVLKPLFELCPNRIHPVYRRSIREMLEELQPR